MILLLILFVIENTTMAWSGAKIKKGQYIHKCPKKKNVIYNNAWGIKKIK